METVTFAKFSQLLNEVENQKKHGKKMDLIEKFWKTHKDKDLYPYIRLLCPAFDKKRNNYGLKEVKIAKYYIEILAITGTEDALRLLNWKDPKRNKNSSTSFSDVVYYVLKNRGWRDSNQKSLTVEEINQELDILQETPDKKDQLFKILKVTSPLEQKWLIRIILQDLRVHLTPITILKAFHPFAIELYNNTTDLQEVCRKFQDPNYKYERVIKPFSMIKPMLADFTKNFQLTKNSYVSEQKYDGERIMIHKEDDKICYFSRNSVDYTETYQKKMNPIVQENVIAKSCILDGEMMVFDNILGRFKEFGHNKTIAKSDEEEDCNLCFVAFDILYFNGKDLTELPLFERRKFLQKSFTPIENKLMITTQISIYTEDDMKEHLEKAILDRNEGIIIKDLDSKYLPGIRDKSWLKLKPDHIDGMGETFDLVIIGGFEGTKFKRRSISHFLLGLKKDNSYVPFCKVGSGYTNEELTKLQTLLKPHWIEYQNNYFNGWTPSPSEKPSFVIDAKNSVILEVKATSVVPTIKYKAGYTLRFPRVLKIRYDKTIEECSDENLINTLLNKENTETNLKDKKILKEKKTRVKNVVTIFNQKNEFLFEQVSKIFQDLEFCIITSDKNIQKQDLEEMISSNGGKRVQNPSKNTNFIISSDSSHIRVQNILKLGESEYDIVHPLWISDCVSKNERLDLHPKYMIYTSKKTRKEFNKRFDKYNDEYKVDSTVEALKFSLEFSKKDKQPKKEQVLKNVTKYLPKLMSHLGLFFDRIDNESPLYFLETLSRYNGAKILNILDSNVTHIIVDENSNKFGTFLMKCPNAKIVSNEWIKKCLENNMMIDEKDFLVKIPSKLNVQQKRKRD